MPPITKPRLITVCLVCRDKRTRCDKARPACQECRRRGTNCTYSTRSRNVQTGRVSRGVEETPKRSETREPDPEPSWYQEETTNNGSTMYDQASLETVFLPSNHLILQRGSQIRNISKTFWGFVSNHERLSEAILFEEEKRPEDLPPSHVSSVSLAKVLNSLPTKPIYDALFRRFLVSVYPIHPLVDIPTFQSDCHAFWEWAAAGSRDPPAKLIQDPSFTCLLFAVLYSGASVTPISAWQDFSSPLATIERKTTIEQLSEACSGSLNACQHTAHPTINTLVASILAHQFSNEETPLQQALFVSTAVRLAQSMGLHRLREVPRAGFARDYRNRIWSHIIWLDVQSSIASGLPTCYHSTVTPTGNGPIGRFASLYAHGRYETARQQSLLINRVQSDPILESDEEYEVPSLSIKVLLRGTKEHISLLEGIIDQLPAHQAEQDDLINLWANASPQTHAFLYEDDRSEANVFSTWVKIMLSLLKIESVIMLQKLFLGPPESTSGHKFWSCTVRLCVEYLQIYLSLCRTPVFEPYSWFFSKYFAPRQCSLLILLYLKHQAQAENVQTARGLVNEFLDYICARQSENNHHSSKSPLDIRVLISLREEIDFKLLLHCGRFGAFESTTHESNFTELPVEREWHRSPVAAIFSSFEN